MKVLVIGNGGREHVISWKISANSQVEKIFCAPGNGGTHQEKKCENVNITDIEELLQFAKKNQIDFTIVGPEEPLVEGIVDLFNKEGLSIFGPSKEGAKLEGSKTYAKKFMKKYGIQTAKWESFQEEKAALAYLQTSEFPLVVKADGLAAGKGVLICKTLKEAEEAVQRFMVEKALGRAGSRIVIEEYLEGVEASILAITDGNAIVPFLSAKDHKKIGEQETGLNTGGMGAICPNPYCSQNVMEDFYKNIMNPTLEGIKKEGFDYCGILFFGIMITKKGTYLLEYNVRMGDPEAQAVLPLLQNDLLEIMERVVEKKVKDVELLFHKGSSCCIVGTSLGYPENYEVGFSIHVEPKEGSKVFIAGGQWEKENLITTGGRVLSVQATGKTLDNAIERAYEGMEKVQFKGLYYRKDIGIL